MKSGWFGMVLVAILSNAAASAQQTYSWSSSSVPLPGAATPTYFPAGTPLTFRTRTELNTKQARPGDRVFLEIADDLIYRGQVVVPAGAPAFAEVARSERNGHFGTRGEIVLRLLYAETPHGQVRLTGETMDRGKSGTALSIATITFVSVLGFLIHGTSGRLPYGTVFTGYLGEPLRFASKPVVREAALDRPDQPRILPARFDPNAFGASRQAGR